MKKIFTLFCIAAAAMAALSCAREIAQIDDERVETSVNETMELTVTGYLGEYQPEDTKSSLVNNIRVAWANGDKVLVFELSTANYLGYLTATINGGDTREAKLSGTISAGEGDLGFIHGTGIDPGDYEVGRPYSSISLSLADQGASTPFMVYGTADCSGDSVSNLVVHFDFASSVIGAFITGLPASSTITSLSLNGFNSKCSISISDMVPAGNTFTSIVKTVGLGSTNAKGQAYVEIAVPNSYRTDRSAVLNVAGVQCTSAITSASIAVAHSYNTIIEVVQNALIGEFSVGETNKVRFSRGNLQASVNASGVPRAWNFAANQYDCIGSGGANALVCSAAGDIDLFGWSTANTIFGINSSRFNETYSGEFVDWGGIMGEWRTLSKDEWNYLLGTRPGAQDKVGYAKVCGVYGVIILPDSFADPETNENVAGVTTFVPVATTGSWPLQEANVYSAGSGWDAMAAAGAVFLPASGRLVKNSTPPHDLMDEYCRYWTSTSVDADCSYGVSCIFSTEPGFTGLYISDDLARSYGLAVRLVQDV